MFYQGFRESWTYQLYHFVVSKLKFVGKLAPTTKILRDILDFNVLNVHILRHQQNTAPRISTMGFRLPVSMYMSVFIYIEVDHRCLFH